LPSQQGIHGGSSKYIKTNVSMKKKKNQGQDASLSTDSLESNFEKRWTFAYNTSFISLSFVAMAPSKVRWQNLYIFIL